MHTHSGLSVSFITLALILLVLCSHAAARYFDFVRSANYLEPGNWRAGAPPCPRDTARLPNTPGRPPLIGLSAPVSPRELLLPDQLSGDETGLVMFDGAELRTFDSADASTPACRNARIRQADFNLTAPVDWFHAGNWRRRRGSGEATSAQLFDALPVDRVPGACDAVRFQANSVYWVRVLGPGNSLPVGELTFGGRKFGPNKADFAEYWRGSARSYVDQQFARRTLAADAGVSEEDGGSSAAVPPLSLAVGDAPGIESQCETPLPVQNPDLMKRVCADLGEQGICSLAYSALLHCPHPISPDLIVGACCSLCGLGAVVEPADTGLFQLARVKAKLLEFVRRSGAEGKALRLSAIRTSVQEATYQIVVACPSGSGGTCASAVMRAMIWLESMGPKMHYRVINSTLGHGRIAQPSSMSSGSGLTGWLTATLLIVTILAIAAFLAVCYRRGGLRLRSSVLSWWQQRPRKLQEEGAPDTSPEASVTGAASAVTYAAASQSVSGFLAFSNPSYDVSQPEGIIDLTERSTVLDEEAEAEREV